MPRLLRLIPSTVARHAAITSSFFLFAFLALISGVVAQDTVPKLDQRVTDFTNTISYAEWSRLELESKAFEDSTSNQVVILLVESTGDESIEEYANRVFEKNAIGQKDKNNGVLIVVSLDDRKVRIEVGYGLEGVLTDAITRKIIETEIKPRFRDEQYFAGLIGAVYAIAGAVAGEYTADGGGEAPFIGSGFLVFFIILVFFVLRPLLASRRRSVISSGRHAYYSGWGWGGGRSGGGGFGGFSGGGGLSGGGGATGSW